ncbi:uncharacterized protein DFL_003376 [Arthrobotrys flagrans]|uniref:Uncharacterized protein n=1 Tax=Arthrobotrys flagrans TaxID=97331 RepID=A0A437A1N2_ARTFL|nr:hypothetical protein DFL_003376 [Arthrobotrys flagrans]
MEKTNRWRTIQRTFEHHTPQITPLSSIRNCISAGVRLISSYSIYQKKKRPTLRPSYSRTGIKRFKGAPQHTKRVRDWGFSGMGIRG